MNAKTADGIVHALRGGVMDGGKRVACGLKGQQHTLTDKDKALVAAEPSNEEVTCLACLAVGDADENDNGRIKGM